MTSLGERLFRLLLRAYPRGFRERYAEDLVAFRIWTATLRDLARVATAERFLAAPPRCC